LGNYKGNQIGKKKEKEDMRTKWATELGSATKRTIWKTINKHVQAQFTTTWTSIAISRVDDHFHHDFQMGFQTYSHKYMGAQQARVQTWAKQ
jgi:hypothetical protein